MAAELRMLQEQNQQLRWRSSRRSHQLAEAVKAINARLDAAEAASARRSPTRSSSSTGLQLNCG